MKALLDAVTAAVSALPGSPAVGINRRPETGDGLPHAVVVVPSSQVTGPIAPGLLDADRGWLIQLSAYGHTPEQAALLAGQLDGCLNGLAITGTTVMKVQTEQQFGPLRDDATAPEPGMWVVHTDVRVWTTPS